MISGSAADRAVTHAAVPLLLAAGTTALGLLSLVYSDLKPIRMFGVFSAVGVLIGSASQFLLLPAAWTVLMPGGRRAHGDGVTMREPRAPGPTWGSSRASGDGS